MSAASGLADPPSLAPHQSALSTRITNVLSASYSDLEIRDALAVLDGRNFVNTAESRRRLRLDVQEEVISANGAIIDDFGAVADELRRVEAILSRISTTCAALRAHVDAASSNTAPMRDEAKALLSQKRAVETKEAVLAAFQSHFLLDDAAVAALTSPSEPVDDAFFAALAKLKRIHTDSQVLLSSAHDRLGLSVLEGSGKTLTAAFQKLFRWTQRAFRALDLENPQLGASLRRALRALAERPALFASSLDNFAATREQTLAASFHAALTGEGAGGGSKPIELHAHDPLRYVGDMLAWAHAAAVGEREALEVLFVAAGDELARGRREGAANDPWARVSAGAPGAGGEAEPAFDGRAALAALVARDLAGVAAELRARAAQAIQGVDGAVAAFRVANLLAFYRGTFARLLPSGGDSASLGPDASGGAAGRQGHGGRRRRRRRRRRRAGAGGLAGDARGPRGRGAAPVPRQRRRRHGRGARGGGAPGGGRARAGVAARRAGDSGAAPAKPRDGARLLLGPRARRRRRRRRGGGGRGRGRGGAAWPRPWTRSSPRSRRTTRGCPARSARWRRSTRCTPSARRSRRSRRSRRAPGSRRGWTARWRRRRRGWRSTCAARC